MQIPGRTYRAQNGYRYGFNGKENDNEVKGEANSLDFGARVYDPRIGRWFSIDSKTNNYPMLSPYNFSANNPVVNQDYDGRDYILKIFLDDAGVGQIQIIYNAIATSEDNLKVLEDGLNLWRALNGSEVMINDIPFKVNFITNTRAAASHKEAEKELDMSEYTNLYTGNTYANGDPVQKKTLVTTYTVTGDKINGVSPSYTSAVTFNGYLIHSKLIEIVNTDFSGLSADQLTKFAEFLKTKVNEIDEGKDPISIAHEIGHTLGLNHNGSYNAGRTVGSGSDSYISPFDPTGTMTGEFQPNIGDLKNVILEALHHKGKSVFPRPDQLKIEITDQVLQKLFPAWDGKAETKPVQTDISKTVIK